VVVGIVLDLGANAVWPRRMPYITPPKPILKAQDTVTLKETEELWKGGTAFFLDARVPADYAAGHIAGALSLPVE
jgi:3-mercaptopyruvate sulfurtransferase SseA